MISAVRVAEIEELLARGVPRREVARRARVSRETVARIAAAPRHDANTRALRDPEESAIPHAAECQRCPGCGGLVLMPCRLCAARRAPSAPLPPAPAEGRQEYFVPTPAQLAAFYRERATARMRAHQEALAAARREAETLNEFLTDDTDDEF